MPCCEVPAECVCALEIPSVIYTEDPETYPDYSTALDRSTNYVAGCALYCTPNLGNDLGSPVQNVTALGLDLSVPDQFIANETATFLSSPPTDAMLISVNMKAGSVLSMSWIESDNGTAGNVAIVFQLYTCHAVLVEELIETTTTGTAAFSALASDGNYILFMRASNNNGDQTSISFSVTASCSDAMFPNPVIALWDDSGTTRQLEACPKLILPDDLGAIYGDTPFPNETVAASFLAEDANTDCLFWVVNIIDTKVSASAVLSAGTYTISYVVSRLDNPAGLGGFTSIDVVAGDVITTVWTASTSGSTGGPSTGQVTADLVLLPVTGGIVYSSDVDSWNGISGSGTLVVTAPFTGKILLSLSAASDRDAFPGTITLTANFSTTSSGTMAVNPVQALYTVGLDCPARLDC